MRVGGNGNANGVSFWVSKRPAPWVRVGTLATLPDIVKKYPLKSYKLGIRYNSAGGAIHDATVRCLIEIAGSITENLMDIACYMYTYVRFYCMHTGIYIHIYVCE